MTADTELDFAVLSGQLCDAADRGGWQLVLDRCVDSTNRRVRDQAASVFECGESVPCVAVAAEQTTGRGRRGATWHSAPGAGLWFSLVVPASSDGNRAPPALALAARLAACLAEEGVPVGVKWPNDLYLGDAKVGGLLFERSTLAGQSAWLVGVGINWCAPAGPLEGGYQATGLGDWLLAAGRPRASEGLACRLIESAVALMTMPDSWGAWVDALRRDHHLFRAVVDVVPPTGGAYTATAHEILADGRLTVELADGDIVPIGPNDRVRQTPRQAE